MKKLSMKVDSDSLRKEELLIRQEIFPFSVP